MANINLTQGKITQYQGPFSEGEQLNFEGDLRYKIGISIGEDDYMSFSGINRENFQSIPVVINNKQIQIGKTYIYEPGFALQQEIGNFFQISFPKGCPPSTLIEITTMEKPIE